MISPETIALVKERTDLVALIGETVRLARRGRKFLGLCPFHKEKSPSFNVNAESGFYHCFGCKESGSAVDFVMKTEGRTFPEAIRLLADRAGIEVGETLTDNERREASAARRAKEDLYAVNHLAATYFEQCLRGGHGPAPHALAHHAREELVRRGLPLPEHGLGVEGTGEGEPGDAAVADALQAFRIGYAPYGWDGLATFFRQQGISPLVAEKVGLLAPRSTGTGHYDRFRHRLMFAVSDVMGRVIAFSGRALPEPTPEELATHDLRGPAASPDGPPAKYINSPESPIYIKGDHLFGLFQARQAVRQLGEAILVEGNFDVVALHARGIRNVVAPLGTAFTPAQAKLLKRFAPKVTVLFDGDAAGKKATRASRAACREGGLDAKVGSLPAKTDPDEFVRKQGSAGLERLLKQATGMLEHLIDDALETSSFGGSTLTEQLSRVRAVAAILAEEDDPNLRTMAKTYADRLSSQLIILGRSPTDLRQLELIMEQATSRRPIAPAASQSAQTHEHARSRSQEEKLSLDILGALLDFPELLDDPEVLATLDVLEGEPALMVGAMRQQLGALAAAQAGEARQVPNPGAPGAGEDRQKPTTMGIYSPEFLAQIPRSIHSFAVGRVASPEHELVGEARSVLLANAERLRNLGLKREQADGGDELRRVEAQGDIAAIDASLAEIRRLMQEKRLAKEKIRGK